MIYFDYNATTPLDPQVREAMLPFLGENFGNPSSPHRIGQRARAVLDEARGRMARVWKCKPSEVVFTSGGTESNNLAIFGAARRLKDKGRHLITSSIEHHSVLNCFEYLAKKEGFTLTILPVDVEGRVSPESLVNVIRPDTILVSVMAANNEIGTIQPVQELGRICRERGVVFHTDAAQWIGKEPCTSIQQFNADLASICAHKFHGPKGAGALYIKSPTPIDPVLMGGGHENERRAGTENLAGIMGLAEAMERFALDPVFSKCYLKPLVWKLTQGLEKLPGLVIRSPQTACLSNTIAFTVNGIDSATLLAALDLAGVCASSGSACTAGSLQPSHVLKAMGLDQKTAASLIRFSLGRESTETEVSKVLEAMPMVIKQAGICQ